MATQLVPVIAADISPELGRIIEGSIACECMLCDEPDRHDEMPVKWKLIWQFNRAPAVEHGEASMLLCDHCLRDWLDNPDDFGGDPVRYFPV